MIRILKMITDETRILEKNKAADNFGRLTQSRLPQLFFKSNLDKHNDHLIEFIEKVALVSQRGNWGWNRTSVPIETNVTKDYVPYSFWT